MNKIKIDTIEEYDLCLKHGINPLFWHRFIKIDINLRHTIQNSLFGIYELSKGNVLLANDKYYHYCFKHSTLRCENCGQKVFNNRNLNNVYSSTNISHIISRGSNPEIAHDPRNHNFLCFNCHSKWENGNRKEMLIYLDNKVIIQELREDYF